MPRGPRNGHWVHAIVGCQRCLTTPCHRRLLFEKKLTPNDLKKFYIPREHVGTLHRAALSGGEANITNLLFHDAGMNHWVFRLSENKGGRFSLTGEWGQFLGAKKLNKGETIQFYELTCKKESGATFFQISHFELFGHPIDKA